MRTFLTREQSMFLAKELRSAADQLDTGAVHGACARIRSGSQGEATLQSSMTFSQRFGFHTDAHGAAAAGL